MAKISPADAFVHRARVLAQFGHQTDAIMCLKIATNISGGTSGQTRKRKAGEDADVGAEREATKQQKTEAARASAEECSEKLLAELMRQLYGTMDGHGGYRDVLERLKNGEFADETEAVKALRCPNGNPVFKDKEEKKTRTKK